MLRMFGMFAVAAIGAAAALAQQDVDKPVGGSFKLLSGAAVQDIADLKFGDITRPTGDGGKLLMTCNSAGEAVVTVPETAKNPNLDDDQCGSFGVSPSEAISFDASIAADIYFSPAGSEPFRNGETVLETRFSLFANGAKRGNFDPNNSGRSFVHRAAGNNINNTYSIGVSAEIGNDTPLGLYTASFEIVVIGPAPPPSQN